jgi:hypothetical protein
MKPKLFLLAFDPQRSDATTLHNVITSLPFAHQWWHYLGSAYILATVASALDIQSAINTQWKGFFIVAQIDAYNSGGWLPAEAWDWINQRR